MGAVVQGAKDLRVQKLAEGGGGEASAISQRSEQTAAPDIVEKTMFCFDNQSHTGHVTTHDTRHETRGMTFITLMTHDTRHDTRHTKHGGGGGREGAWGGGECDKRAKRANCGPGKRVQNNILLVRPMTHDTRHTTQHTTRLTIHET